MAPAPTLYDGFTYCNTVALPPAVSSGELSWVVASGVAIAVAKIAPQAPGAAGASRAPAGAAEPRRPPFALTFLQQGASGTWPPGQGGKAQGHGEGGEGIAEQLGGRNAEKEIPQAWGGVIRGAATRLRRRRLTPKAAPAPSSGRGPGTLGAPTVKLIVSLAVYPSEPLDWSVQVPIRPADVMPKEARVCPENTDSEVMGPPVYCRYAMNS